MTGGVVGLLARDVATVLYRCGDAQALWTLRVNREAGQEGHQ